MPSDLRRDLERSFSSIETLRREFVATATAMFGPGFVWLVQTGPSDFAILPTYLAGSPYPAAHWRRQDVDMNTTGAHGSAGPWLRNAQVKGMPQKKDEAPPGSAKVMPLLCVNTWEHVWLRDYGVGYGGQGGKKAFCRGVVGGGGLGRRGVLDEDGEARRLHDQGVDGEADAGADDDDEKGEEAPMPPRGLVEWAAFLEGNPSSSRRA